MHDHYWLYNAPGCPGAVQWSEDNHLAVAAANTVVILNPGHLNGARSYAAAPTGASLSPYQVDGVPQDSESSAQFAWAVNAEINATRNLPQPVRSVAWSPAGCTLEAGCLLATITIDHQVRLYSAPVKGLGSMWEEVLDVTELLKQSLRDRDWQDLDVLTGILRPAGSSSSGAGNSEPDQAGSLRLRGGAGDAVGRVGPTPPSQSPPRLTAVAVAAARPDLQDTLAAGQVVTAAGQDDVLRLRGGGRATRSQAAQAGTDATPSASAPGVAAEPAVASPSAPPSAKPTAPPAATPAAAPSARTARQRGAASGAAAAAAPLAGAGAEAEVAKAADAAGRGGAAAAGASPPGAAGVDQPSPPVGVEEGGKGEGASAGGAGKGSGRRAGKTPAAGSTPGTGEASGKGTPAKAAAAAKAPAATARRGRTSKVQEAAEAEALPAESSGKAAAPGEAPGDAPAPAPSPTPSPPAAGPSTAGPSSRRPSAGSKRGASTGPSKGGRKATPSSDMGSKLALHMQRTGRGPSVDGGAGGGGGERPEGGRQEEQEEESSGSDLSESESDASVPSESSDSERDSGEGGGRGKGRGKGKGRGRAAAGGDGGGRGRGRKGKGSQRKKRDDSPDDLDVSQTPADAFSGLVPEVDITNDAQVARYSSQLVAKRFLYLRSELPEGPPRYNDVEREGKATKELEAIKPVDSAFLKRAIKEMEHVHAVIFKAPHKVDYKILVRNSRALIRHYIVKAEAQARQEEGEGAPPSGARGGAPSANKTSRPPIKLAPYDASTTAPDTFTSLVMDVNVDNPESLAEALPNMLFQRFVQLRNALPADSLPVYEPRAHLRDPDAGLLTRAYAEMAYLYKDRLGAKLQDREVNTKVRKLIRQRVIGTKPYHRADMGGMYVAPLLGGGIQGAGSAPAARPASQQQQGQRQQQGQQQQKKKKSQRQEDDDDDEEEGLGDMDVGDTPPDAADGATATTAARGGKGKGRGKDRDTPVTEGRSRRPRKQVKYTVDEEEEESGGSEDGEEGEGARRQEGGGGGGAGVAARHVAAASALAWWSRVKAAVMSTGCLKMRRCKPSVVARRAV